MRNFIKKALWPVMRKPWNAPDMEFHYGLWNGVSSLYCESGRQLGEENTRPFPLNHHLPAETIVSKYSGSRSGRRINMSALRTAMLNFDGALAITAAVRSFHLKRIGNDGPPGIWDLYIIARASIALVAYQQRFIGDQPSRAKVSDVLTSQYQFISGIFMICRHMMEEADPAIATNDIIAADALYSYADVHGIFISSNGMGCAGSTKKILEFLDFCNNGVSSADGDQEELDLSSIVGKPRNWYEYALATIELDCFIEIEKSHSLDRKLSEAHSQSKEAADIYRSLQTYCCKISPALSGVSNADNFIDAALVRQNKILAFLNRPIITRLPENHVYRRLR